MTQEELKAEIAKQKISCFDLVRGFALKRNDPKVAGYATHEEAVLTCVAATARSIERMLRQWEKENPS